MNELSDSDVMYYINKVVAKETSSYILDGGCYYFNRENDFPIRVMEQGNEYEVIAVPHIGY